MLGIVDFVVYEQCSNYDIGEDELCVGFGQIVISQEEAIDSSGTQRTRKTTIPITLMRGYKTVNMQNMKTCKHINIRLIIIPMHGITEPTPNTNTAQIDQLIIGAAFLAACHADFLVRKSAVNGF